MGKGHFSLKGLKVAWSSMDLGYDMGRRYGKGYLLAVIPYVLHRFSIFVTLVLDQQLSTAFYPCHLHAFYVLIFVYSKPLVWIQDSKEEEGTSTPSLREFYFLFENAHKTVKRKEKR